MIKLRPAKISDCKFWWKVRNEKTVKAVSFNTKPIPYSTHKKWFDNKIKNQKPKIKKNRLFIIYEKNRKIGQLRLERINADIEINLALAPQARGKSLGTEAIKKGVEFAIQKMNAEKVLAYTKPQNLASIAAFKKAGFKNLGEVGYKDSSAILLEFSD